MMTSRNWNQTKPSQAQAQLPTSVLAVAITVGSFGKTKMGRHWILCIESN